MSAPFRAADLDPRDDLAKAVDLFQLKLAALQAYVRCRAVAPDRSPGFEQHRAAVLAGYLDAQEGFFRAAIAHIGPAHTGDQVDFEDVRDSLAEAQRLGLVLVRAHEAEQREIAARQVA